jgi:adenine/guanine phosphoribosyltransferase-like PRPP-binding protein
MMPWPNTDVVLMVDHAGELIGRYVGLLRSLPAYEVRREKAMGPDGKEIVTRVILPPNVEFKGKNVFLLDEFVGSGYTLRVIIDEIHRAGGRIIGIGVIATLGGGVPELAEMPYTLIPITTLVKL